jgi:membrane-bound metal-dependent hydrolase YbcI (DUF457 family)
MINIYIVLSILFLHWFADFVAQNEYQALNKSSKWSALLEHTLMYSLIFAFFSIVMTLNVGPKDPVNWKMLLFAPITFVTHTAIDYYTSRVNKQLWDQKNVHQFFVSIGFDQFLHIAQLLLTYKLLS